MYRKFAIAAAVLAAFVLTAPGANAKHKHADKRLGYVSLGVGAAWTAGTLAAKNLSVGAGIGVGTFGCAVTSPMVATAVLNRPLTYREAHVLIGSCIIPVVGGWLVNEAYDSGVFWAPDEKPAHAWHRHHHHKKK
jgi:hypothetical protein